MNMKVPGARCMTCKWKWERTSIVRRERRTLEWGDEGSWSGSLPCVVLYEAVGHC